MNKNYFSEDIQEFIELLYTHKVKYMIVGGEAVIYYGYPRLTGDVDFFYENSKKNVKKLYNALNDFWEDSIPGVTHENDLLEEGIIIQFGVPPNRIDLINTIDNVPFREAWDNRTIDHLHIKNDKINVYLIGPQQLIKNKQAVKRNKDIDDLRYLQKRFSSKVKGKS